MVLIWKRLCQAVACLAFIAPAVQAQQYNLSVTPTFPTTGTSNLLYLTVKIWATGAPFQLSSSDLELDLGANNCFYLAGATVNTPYNAAFTGGYYGATPFTVSTPHNSIVLHINVPNIAALGSVTVPVGAPSAITLATIAVPILDCNCSTPLSYNTTSSNVQDNTGVLIATAGATLPAVLVTTPPQLGTLTATNNLSSITTCTGGSSYHYTSATGELVFWELISDIGSVITTSPVTTVTTGTSTNTHTNNPSAAIDILFGAPTSTVTDVLNIYHTPLYGMVGACVTSTPLTVYPPPSSAEPLAVVSAQPICPNTSVSLTLASSQPGVTYSLYKAPGTLLTTVAGDVSGGPIYFNLPSTTFTATQTYQLYYTASRTIAPACLTANSPTLFLAVGCAFSGNIISPSNGATICGGGNTSCRTDQSDLTVNTFWSVLNPDQIGLLSFPGGNTGNSINVQFANVAAPTSLTLVANMTKIATGASAQAQVTLNLLPNVPSITPATAPGNQLLLVGPSVTQNYLANSLLTGPYTYSWTVTPPLGVTVATPAGANTNLTFTNAGFYQVGVTVSNGTCSGSTTYGVLVTTCDANPGTASANQTVCYGTGTDVFVNGSVSGNLNWQTSTNGASWSNVPGATGALYTTPALTTSTYYRLQATDASGTCSNYSQSILLTVLPAPAAGSITPASVSICNAGPASFTVAGASGSLQWEASENGFSWASAAGVNNTASYTTPTPLTVPTYFRVRVYNGCAAVYSSPVLAEVSPIPIGTITYSVGTVPQSICAGTTTTQQFIGTPSAVGLVGFWASNGQGSLNVISNSPTNIVTYTSSLLDTTAGIVVLSYVVPSGSCAPFVSNIFLPVDKPSVATITTSFPGLATYCHGSTTDSIFATTKGALLWDDGGAGGTFFPNASAARITYRVPLGVVPSPLTLTLTATSGNCAPATASITVPVNPSTIDGFLASLPSSVCYPGAITLHAGATLPAAGLLASSTGLGKFTQLDATHYSYALSPLEQGQKVTFFWQVTNASCAPLLLSTTTLVQPQPLAVVITPTTALCQNTSLQLYAIAQGGSGAWTLTDTLGNAQPSWGVFSDASSTTPIFNATAAGYNHYLQAVWTVTSAVACSTSTSASVRLHINDAPGGGITSGALPTICAGSTTPALTATLSNGSTGTWFSPNGAGFFTNPTALTTTYVSSVTDAGKSIILQWQVSNGACGTLAPTPNITLTVSTSFVDGAFPGTYGPGLIELQPICAREKTAPLGGTVVAPSLGMWSSTGGGTFVNPGTGLVDNTFGNAVYVPNGADVGTTPTITWTITNGVCNPRIIARQLTVYDSIRAFFPQPPSVCYPGNSIPLGASLYGGAGTIGTWSIVSGAGGITAFNDPNAQYTPNVADVGKTVQLQWQATNGGKCMPDMVTRSVKVRGTQELSIYRLDMPGVDSTCAGDSILLRLHGGVGVGGVAWLPSGLRRFINDSTVKVSASISQFTAALFLGTCPVAVNYNLKLLKGSPITAQQVTPGNTCVGSTAQLTVTGNVDNKLFFWSRIDGTTAGMTNVTTKTCTVIPGDTTTYRVIASTLPAGCQSNAFVTVNVVKNQPPLFGPVKECADALINQTLEVKAFNYSNTQTKFCNNPLWFNVPRDTLLNLLSRGVILDASSPYYVYNQEELKTKVLPGRYFFTLYCPSAQGGCLSLAEVPVLINKSANADFTAKVNSLGVPDTVIYAYSNSDSVRFQALHPSLPEEDPSTTTYKYKWSFGDPTESSDSTIKDTLRNITHRFPRSGNYTVSLFVTDLSSACANFLVKSNYITVRAVDYFFPTAFTPNQDTFNTLFRALPLEAPVKNLQVYDRNGSLVYEALNNSGWDGCTPDGSPLQVGVYTYKAVIELEDTGIFVTKTGYVHLLR